MLGQAVAFSPDYQKAKIAAARILKLLDLRGNKDVFSKQGKVLVSISFNLKVLHLFYKIIQYGKLQLCDFNLICFL